MVLGERIEAFSILGSKIKNISKKTTEELSLRARSENQWFTEDNIYLALQGIAYLLDRQELEKWLANYQIQETPPKQVGIIMAGNIPLVGFHDLLMVLISGHRAAIKTSSQDSYLPRLIIEWLLEIEPRFKELIDIRDRLTNIDAVIATGSDNTSRYFDYYFRDIPKIIRKNRTSVAVLDGSETNTELEQLGKDIFWYFGLGCRNVSKLCLPQGYDPKEFFEAIESFNHLAHHNKYVNNHDYYRSIFLVNGTKHLDNGFLIWLPSQELVSPIAVLYTEEFTNNNAVDQFLKENELKIQCVIGKNHLAFGTAQLPGIGDFADNVDTLSFLTSLK